MAKSKSKTNKPKTTPAKLRRRRVRAGPSLTPYQHVLLDPCDGPLVSPYPGERGIIQRFTQDLSLNVTAGFTAGFLMFSPAANTYFYNANAASNVAIAPATGVACAGPFLGSSSIKFRPLAACVEIIPSAVSYNSLTGEIGASVCATNQLSTAGTYKVDDVFTLCQSRSVLAKKNYEIRWFPGSLDGTYSPTVANGSATLTDQADQNAILVAYRGYPAGVTLSIRLTLVLEWTPAIGTGTATTSIPSAGIDFAAQASQLHRLKPSWWNNLGSGAAEDAGHLARDLLRRGMYTGAAYGANYLYTRMAGVNDRNNPYLMAGVN